jgi:ribonuclease BN (tRNA processing enzyme)
MAGPDSAASCYLVQADDGAGRRWNVVLDLGSGAFGALMRYIDPGGIDAVCLTHLHADHCADLVGLSVWAKYAPGRSGVPVRLWGPRGTVERVRQLAGRCPGDEDSGAGGLAGGTGVGTGGSGDEDWAGGDGHGPWVMDEIFEVRTWAPGAVVGIGPLRVTPYVADHPVEAYALRLAGPSEREGDGEAILTYTGDSDVGAGVEAASAEADLLLAEAAFVDGRDGVTGVHMTATQAAALAVRARAKSLVLTHIAPWDDPGAALAAARAIYPGPTHLATPGAVHAV